MNLVGCGACERPPAKRGPRNNRMKLSIIIPVYNFGEFLPDTLKSILKQRVNEVEVLVVDGASTDNTTKIVSQFSSRHPQIKYHRLPKKGGIDRDLAKAVQLATSEYCWLFSGDDVMATGAIARVLQEIQTDDDIYLCKHEECTRWMEVIDVHPVLEPDVAESFDLSDPQQRLEYFRRARNSEAFFSFIGGIILKRSVWERGFLDPRFIGSCFAHSARLLSLTNVGLRLRYINTALLSRRGDNDSFAGNGYVDRLRMQVDGFHDIVEACFGRDSAEAIQVRRAIRNEFTPTATLVLKYRCMLFPKRERKALLDRIVARAYQDRSWACIKVRLAYRLSPCWLIRRRYRWACFAHEHPELHEMNQRRLELHYLQTAVALTS
jgi:O-antigen biosynthesis alpha-1,3-abequosyltransferase